MRRVLASLAHRWLELHDEIKMHSPKNLTKIPAPDLVAAFGIGPDIAAEMLVSAGPSSNASIAARLDCGDDIFPYHDNGRVSNGRLDGTNIKLRVLERIAFGFNRRHFAQPALFPMPALTTSP